MKETEGRKGNLNKKINDGRRERMSMKRKEWKKERRMSCSTHVGEETYLKYVLMLVTRVVGHCEVAAVAKYRCACITVRMAPSCH
jgi:hypothetical protein